MHGRRRGAAGGVGPVGAAGAVGAVGARLRRLGSDQPAEEPVPEFGERIGAFLDAASALDPIFATHVGNHLYDDAWPDLSAAGRGRRLAFTEEWSAAFSAFGNDELTADERV